MRTTDLKKSKSPEILVDKNMRDYRNDPYVKKKADEAKAFLKKHPLPKEMTERKNKS